MNPHGTVASTEKWGGLCYSPGDRVFLHPRMEQNECDPEQCNFIYVHCHYHVIVFHHSPCVSTHPHTTLLGARASNCRMLSLLAVRARPHSDSVKVHSHLMNPEYDLFLHYRTSETHHFNTTSNLDICRRLAPLTAACSAC